MHPEIPQHIRSLSPYVPGKPIEETKREFGLKRVIKLASNENPLGPSPRALLAVRKVLSNQHRYPDASSFNLKEALSEHLSVSPSEIVVGNGSNEIIDLLIRAFSIPGDRILTSFAAFIAYAVCAQVHGVETTVVPCKEDLKFDLTSALTMIKRDPKIRLVFLANPNNPTGTYVEERELRSFLKEVREVRNGSVIVVLDAAYWEYVTAKDLPDPMKLYREFENVVILRTFSKIYGLAGFRIGYGIMRTELSQVIEKIRMPFNVSTLSTIAAEAALKDAAFVKKSLKVNQTAFRFWEKALSSLGIPYWPSQGNFLLINTLKGLGLSGGEVFQSCLRKGVIFRPVANYGLLHALRITMGTPLENKRALEVLKETRKNVRRN